MLQLTTALMYNTTMYDATVIRCREVCSSQAAKATAAALRSKSINVNSSGGGGGGGISSSQMLLVLMLAMQIQQQQLLQWHTMQHNIDALCSSCSYSASRQASDHRNTGRLEIVEQVSTEVGATCVMLNNSNVLLFRCKSTLSLRRSCLTLAVRAYNNC